MPPSPPHHFFEIVGIQDKCNDLHVTDDDDDDDDVKNYAITNILQTCILIHMVYKVYSGTKVRFITNHCLNEHRILTLRLCG